MSQGVLRRTGFTATALAVAGGVLGFFGAHVYNGQPGRYVADATLALLPGPEVQVAETPAFWEVLNAGQATRTAAAVIGDDRWLVAAASTAGVPRTTLSLSAGAVPQTTLITVRVTASSAESARVALDSVLVDAVGLATRVSGPFDLQTVATPAAKPLGPSNIQVLAALVGAGMLLGAGSGALISRSARKRTSAGGSAHDIDHAPPAANDRESAERQPC